MLATVLCCSWFELESAPVCPIEVAMAMGLATGGGGGGGSMVEGINPAILEALPVALSSNPALTCENQQKVLI